MCSATAQFEITYNLFAVPAVISKKALEPVQDLCLGIHQTCLLLWIIWIASNGKAMSTWFVILVLHLWHLFSCLRHFGVQFFDLGPSLVAYGFVLQAPSHGHWYDWTLYIRGQGEIAGVQCDHC